MNGTDLRGVAWEMFLTVVVCMFLALSAGMGVWELAEWLISHIDISTGWKI
ncbi:MAG: hypothetical protein WD266_00080 [Balneolales bacterium]